MTDPGVTGTALERLAGPGRTGIGCRIVSLAETTSTNDVARDLAAGGAPEGTVVVADRQTRGRGRVGRTWFSPLGGLWCSVILRPPLPLRRLGALPLVIAVAARRAIYRSAGVLCRLKWPNDLLLEGRKLGGVLVECRGGGPDAPPEFVVVGLGINVSPNGAEVSSELRGAAAWLGEAARTPLGAPDLGLALLDELEAAIGRFLALGFESCRAEYLAAMEGLGRQVSVVVGPAAGDHVFGAAEDVDPEGRLVLRLGDGTALRVSAGDAVLGPRPARS